MELKTKKHLVRQSIGAQHAGRLLGGKVVAILIDDLDPAYYGLRFAVPEPASNRATAGKKECTIRYLDVWILTSNDADAQVGYLDIVDVEANKEAR